MTRVQPTPTALMRLYEHPNCTTCGAQTMLARIEPTIHDFEIRTFNCPDCGGEMNLTVKFK